jgi:hypothetical protein
MSVKVKVGKCKICGKETTLTRSKLCIDCAIQKYKEYLTQMITHSGPIWEKYLYYKKLAESRYPLGYRKALEEAMKERTYANAILKGRQKSKVKGAVRRKGKTRT